ncbi:MAG TPA: DUF899 family protein [Ilumatobacter sp.]|jgi:predicted dithiol-disulfide oxidoreductase (DUF899 family)|nr:DUF899 family protein [Ilumatobacter sp.]
MTDLTPAADLAARNRTRHPNESDEYRRARQELLVEEIELRRHVERVAEQRRRLPPGGAVPDDYRFVAEDGTEVTLSDLFGEHDALVVYSYMFGPEREAPCPMCTSFMGGFEHKIPDIRQRVALAFTARSPIERLIAAKRARGWTNMPVFSDTSGDFTRAYVSADDADMPAYNVFTRAGDEIRHFWSEEISGDMADPNQDPRGAVEMDPLWLLLDTVPEGRGITWHPSLTY